MRNTIVGVGHVGLVAADGYLGQLAYPIVVDGRDVHDPVAMRAAGLRDHAIGRPDTSRTVEQAHT